MAFKNPERFLTWPPGAHTGETRIVVGADTPSELQASYDIIAAILFYVVDFTSGLEVGYFFIGTSVEFNGNRPTLVYGEVRYPTPGDPDSATAANVKANQQNIFMSDLVPLAQFFNLQITAGGGGLFFHDGARLASLDQQFGSSDMDCLDIDQDATGGITRISADAFLHVQATSRGVLLEAPLNVDNQGSVILGTPGSDAKPVTDFDGAFVSTSSASFVTLGGGSPNVTFVCPPSGWVRVNIKASMVAAAVGTAHSLCSFEIREDDASGAVVIAASDNHRVDLNAANTVALTASSETFVGPLTPGATYYAQHMYRRVSGGVAAGFAVRNINVEPMLVAV